MPSTAESFGGRSLLGEVNYHIESEAAAGNGAWFDIRGVRSATIHVKNLAAGDSYSVQVSNAQSKPDDDVDGVVDQTIVGDGTEKHVSVSKLPANWGKLDKAGSTDEAEALFVGLFR